MRPMILTSLVRKDAWIYPVQPQQKKLLQLLKHQRVNLVFRKTKAKHVRISQVLAG